MTKNMHFKILKIHFINAMKYPAKNQAKFLKPEPEPDIEAGYPAGSRFSRISGRFLQVSFTKKPTPPTFFNGHQLAQNRPDATLAHEH